MLKKIIWPSSWLFLPGVAVAQLLPPRVNPQAPPGDFGNVLQRLIDFGAGLVIFGAVLFIIYGAILYLVSDLVTDKERAKNVLLYSIVAVAVALLASAIVRLVVNLLGPLS